jgi:acetyl esterase/lipase
MDVIDGMTRLLQAIGVVLLVGGLAYHFAALRIFNFLVQKDAGIALVAEDVAFGKDPQQEMDVYAPEKSTGALPILLFVHGGSWDSGRAKDYDFAARAFAAQGYVVALPCYRFVPKHPYPAFVEDIGLAVREAQRTFVKFGGDPGRIFLVGHSAGGYNVLQATLNSSFMENAGVEPGTIRAVAALAAPADFLPLDSPKTHAAFGKHVPLEETQPISFARQNAPPILLLHGSDDRTVYPKNSGNLAQRLQEKGAVVAHKEYAGVSHVMIMLALAKPLRNRANSLTDITEFFARYK